MKRSDGQVWFQLASWAGVIFVVLYLLYEGDARVEMLQQVLASIVENRHPLVRHRSVLLEKIGHSIGGVHPVHQCKRIHLGA